MPIRRDGTASLELDNRLAKPPPFDPPADRSHELPLDPGQAVLAEAAARVKPKAIAARARSAFEHLRGAWLLHPHDSEMSLFRAITAEEEAATALILALRQQKYPGTTRLNPRAHPHKAAIWPMLYAIHCGIAEKGVPAPKLAIKKSGKPELDLAIDFGALGELGRPLWGRPDHPFNLVIHSDEKGPFEVHRFERELLALAIDRGAATIGAHIAAEANLRNQILYASDQGIPAIRFSDDTLLIRLQRVTWLLVVTIGILQTTTLQLLVVQALEALLIALDKFEGSAFDFPEHQRPGATHLDVAEQPGGSRRLRAFGPAEGAAGEAEDGDENGESEGGRIAGARPAQGARLFSRRCRRSSRPRSRSMPDRPRLEHALQTASTRP